MVAGREGTQPLRCHPYAWWLAALQEAAPAAAEEGDMTQPAATCLETKPIAGGLSSVALVAMLVTSLQEPDREGTVWLTVVEPPTDWIT
jgi:hypothetical protein